MIYLEIHTQTNNVQIVNQTLNVYMEKSLYVPHAAGANLYDHENPYTLQSHHEG